MAREQTREQTSVRALYLTFPDAETAQAVAEQLVARRLVACVNLLPGATSVYRWQGAVVTETECVAIAKTLASKVDAVSAAVSELHPYDVPCVVAYPAVGGLDAYLEWVVKETTG